MRAEVISIGDELTSGQRLDTNSQWLSQRLGELGVPVMFHTTVSDDLAANIDVFRAAVERADLVISTGGLGPTADDLTREALAGVAEVELLLDEASLAHIQALFARRGRDMPERNVVQAMFPAGSQPIHNPEGTAPGIDFFIPRRRSGGTARVVALPGVPAEMYQMWQATVAKIAATFGSGQMIRHRRIKCFGAGESEVERMLPDVIRRGRVPTVGITVSDATITLRITASGDSPEACGALIEPTARTIYDCLGKLVYGEDDDELQHAVWRLLKQRGTSVATAEWGTAGLVADWLGAVAGDEGYFIGGVVVVGESSAMKSLELKPDQLSAAALDDGRTVEALAQAVRQRFGSDLGLAVGRFPPASDNAGNPPPQVRFALASREGVASRAVGFSGHSAIVKQRAAKSALNFLRLSLLELT